MNDDLLYPQHETLYPWQPDNVRGILKVWRDGSLTGTGTAIGALLASGMGMGKCSISIIAANTAGLERVLVIAPKAAIPDWIRDLRRFHTRTPLIRHLSARKRWIDIPVGWVLLNYANVDRWPELKAEPWDLLIVDEAQAVKEPSTKRTNFIFGGKWKGKTVKPIPCRKAIIVSGTPLKNRPEELFTQLHFLEPKRWSNRGAFIRQYYQDDVKTDRQGREHVRKVQINPHTGRVTQSFKTHNLIELGKTLYATVLVRAGKDDAGLPPKHFEQILSPVFEIPLHTAEWFDAKSAQLNMLGLALIEARKQALEGNASWDEVKEIEDQIHEIQAAMRFTIGELKAPSVLGYLKTLTEKTLVICHHLHILHQLERALKDEGRGVVVHSGEYGSPVEAVKQFQTDPAVQFFIGQAMAASLSITLTAAHHVVVAELPQTRADFDQAVDRVHRIGQSNNVLVTVFTLDWSCGDGELLDYMHEKKAVAEQILDLKEDEEQLLHWDWKQQLAWCDNRLVPLDDADYQARCDKWYEQYNIRMFARLGSIFGLNFDNLQELTPRQKAKHTIQLLLAKADNPNTPREQKHRARYAIRDLMKKFDIEKMEILRVIT
jgi:SNF2 family DNA or RNA helicase